MANPQPTDAHLRMAHTINEAIMMRDFSKVQRKILDLILRLSWGCGKKYAYIPHQRDFMIVGVHEVKIKYELDWLTTSKIIFRRDTIYWFNKNFEEWQISRVHPFEPEKLNELLSYNLNGTGTEKLNELLNESPKLNETLSENLTNSKEKTLLIVKLPTPKLASPKESIKKVLDKDIYGEFKNVSLTKDEHDKLIVKFGVKGTADRIENLSTYLESKGRRYKSHYATILSWERRNDKDGANQRNTQKLPERNNYTRPEDYGKR